METKHHRYTRVLYFIAGDLKREKRKKKEGRPRGKHEGEGGQDAGGARAIVTGPSALARSLPPTKAVALEEESSGLEPPTDACWAAQSWGGVCCPYLLKEKL